MTPEILEALFGIAGAIARQIWDAIQRGDERELRRLASVWPNPIRSRIFLLQMEKLAVDKAERATRRSREEKD